MNVCICISHIHKYSVSYLSSTHSLFLKISETENKPSIESDRFPHIYQRSVAETGTDRKRFPGITADCASVFTPLSTLDLIKTSRVRLQIWPEPRSSAAEPQLKGKGEGTTAVDGNRGCIICW